MWKSGERWGNGKEGWHSPLDVTEDRWRCSLMMLYVCVCVCINHGTQRRKEVHHQPLLPPPASTATVTAATILPPVHNKKRKTPQSRYRHSIEDTRREGIWKRWKSSSSSRRRRRETKQYKISRITRRHSSNGRFGHHRSRSARAGFGYGYFLLMAHHRD